MNARLLISFQNISRAILNLFRMHSPGPRVPACGKSALGPHLEKDSFQGHLRARLGASGQNCMGSS